MGRYRHEDENDGAKGLQAKLRFLGIFFFGVDSDGVQDEEAGGVGGEAARHQFLTAGDAGALKRKNTVRAKARAEQRSAA